MPLAAKMGFSKQVPIPIYRFTTPSPGSYISAGVTSAGSVVTWGPPSLLTVPTAAQSGVIQVASGDRMIALKSNGSVITWGDLNSIPSATQTGVVAIYNAGAEVVALKSNGSFVRWNEVLDIVTPPVLF